MDFAKIERLLDPGCFEHREDIGGYEQPQLWRRYGLGEISPIGNGRKSKNAVDLAEAVCPGSRRVFHSVLWDLLRIKEPTDEQLHDLALKLPESLIRKLSRSPKCFDDPWRCISQLSINQIKKLATRMNLDVLAILLMLIHPEMNLYKKQELVALTTWWLNHAVLINAPTKSVAHLLMPLLEENQPYLGNLKQFISITHVLPESTHLEMAFEWMLWGKEFIEWRKLADPFNLPDTLIRNKRVRVSKASSKVKPAQ